MGTPGGDLEFRLAEMGTLERGSNGNQVEGLQRDWGLKGKEGSWRTFKEELETQVDGYGDFRTG